jgi:hypothetical protein
MKLTSPHQINNNVTTHTAQAAFTRVLDYSGASFKRDAVDNRIINTVRNGNYTAQMDLQEAQMVLLTARLMWVDGLC